MIGFLAFVLTVVLGILVLVGGLQWLDTRRGAIEEPGAAPDRLDRMESALSAIEGRLDDLQEQQRFLERLLAERPERPALPGPGRESEGGVRSVLFDTDAADEGDR